MYLPRNKNHPPLWIDNCLNTCTTEQTGNRLFLVNVTAHGCRLP